MNYFEHYAGTRDRTCDLVDFEETVESIVLAGPVFLSSANGTSPYPTSLQPIAALTTKSVRLTPHGHVGRFPLSTGADPLVAFPCIGHDRRRMELHSQRQSKAYSRTAREGHVSQRWVGWVWLAVPAITALCVRAIAA